MIRGLFVLLVISLLGFTRSAGQRLGVYPSTLEFKLDRGESGTQTVRLFNGTARSLQFRLYLNDWLRDSLGGHVYYRPDTLQQSCSRWISFHKNLITVGPGKTADIDVTLRMPDSTNAAHEMKWSMLFLEQLEDRSDTGGRVIRAEVKGLVRWGVHLYQTPPAASARQITINELAYEANSSTIELVCENVGKAMVTSSFYIELLPATGKRKLMLASKEYPMFPGQRRHIRYPLPKNMRRGMYTARAVVKPGAGLTLDTAVTTVEIE
jgi:hypothetical protein